MTLQCLPLLPIGPQRSASREVGDRLELLHTLIAAPTFDPVLQPADDQLGVAHAASAAVAQQVGPRLRGLAQALGQGDQLLRAVQADPKQDRTHEWAWPSRTFGCTPSAHT